MNYLGTVDIMGMKNKFTGGDVSGNTGKIVGNLNTPVGNFSYDLNLRVDNNDLYIRANTNKGSFDIKGNRIY